MVLDVESKNLDGHQCDLDTPLGKPLVEVGFGVDGITAGVSICIGPALATSRVRSIIELTRLFSDSRYGEYKSLRRMRSSSLVGLLDPCLLPRRPARGVDTDAKVVL